VALEASDTLGIAPVDQLDLQPGLERARRLEETIGGRREIGLREHYDRLHAYIARKNKIAFEARNVEIPVAGCDDKKRIHVRGDKLKSTVVTWG
jgi:hypothetical protein